MSVWIDGLSGPLLFKVGTVKLISMTLNGVRAASPLAGSTASRRKLQPRHPLVQAASATPRQWVVEISGFRPRTKSFPSLFATQNLPQLQLDFEERRLQFLHIDLSDAGVFPTYRQPETVGGLSVSIDGVSGPFLLKVGIVKLISMTLSEVRAAGPLADSTASQRKLQRSHPFVQAASTDPRQWVVEIPTAITSTP